MRVFVIEGGVLLKRNRNESSCSLVNSLNDDSIENSSGNKEQVNYAINDKIAEILGEYDKGYSHRHLGRILRPFFNVCATIFALLQIWYVIVGPPPMQKHRTLFLGFCLFFGFLLYPSTKKGRKDKVPWYDYFLAILSLAVTAYWWIEYRDLLHRAGDTTSLDFIVGGAAILLSLECTRRVAGLPLFVIATISLLYAHFGPYLPGILAHRGFSLSRISCHMYFTTEGIIGIPIGVISTFVFMFIVFASFLQQTGIGSFFIDLAHSLVGRARGGPAKVAVIASALLGTITGSSVANTVGSGSITIPMMKEMGYSPSFAAAVEAAASTGGQLMPPIMGAAAFLMVEVTGIPYIQIALSAAIPAILYFTGVFLGVEFEGRRLNLKGLPKEMIPNFWSIIKSRGHLALPIIGVVFVLAKGMTVTRAALMGILVAIGVSYVKKSTRMQLKDFSEALISASKNAISLGAVAASAGIVVGVITLTGLGLKLTDMIIAVSAGNLLITLFFTMVACIILGMGIPTTANYLITSTVAAPALLKLGVPLLPAHLFVFYFGLIADLTPPVAVAAYAGAGIAQSDPIKTAFRATKLAIAAFIVPYMFVYQPALVLAGDISIFEGIRILISSVVGMINIAAAIQGWLIIKNKWYENIVLFMSGLCLLEVSLFTDILGLIALICVGFLQYRRKGIDSTNK